MACVLVTRPQPAAEALVSELRRAGFDALAAPLMRHSPLSFDVPDPAEHDALAFSSAAAVLLFAEKVKERDRPVFCVGDATAETARKAGFTDVRSAAGDAGDLAALIAESGMARVLHPCGVHRVRELRPELLEKGITLDVLEVYEAELEEALPEDAARALEDGRVAAVLLFSARVAERFLTLAPPAASRGIAAVCLSPRIAEPLARAGWADVRIAPRPEAGPMREILHEMGINGR